MEEAYLGVDIGSISTKGVIIDKNYKILASEYIWTEGDPMGAARKLIELLEKQFDKEKYQIVATGTTGSARKLVGAMLGATMVKNEITAHAVGTTTLYPDVRTILEIGGQDSKIILVENGVAVDYAMNTLCAAGTGSFLSSQAKRLGVEARMPILIAEKMGPHFAVGDTCYSHAEEVKVYNPDGKEIVARDNEVAALRSVNPSKAYFNCHTDITIPYDELAELTAVKKDGGRIPIIANGRFVLPGTEELNEPLRELD